MGVINMAHGELIMIGAYATYVVQNLFRQFAPGSSTGTSLLAIPWRSLVSGAVGVILGGWVIRHLYGRPLETLLATWGSPHPDPGRCARLFGAQNVQVENPSWMSGRHRDHDQRGAAVGRIAIIAFAGGVLLLVTCC